MSVIAVNVTLNTTARIPTVRVPRRDDVHIKFYVTDGSTVTIAFSDPPFTNCGSSFQATGEEGHTCTIDTSAALGSHEFTVSASGHTSRDGDLDLEEGGSGQG
jgi:hypothetical protein